MRKFDTELVVGLFLIIGIACLTYLSVKLGRMEIIGGDVYQIYAEFTDAGGLKQGSTVEIAGVEVGRIKEITLSDYKARVALQINTKVQIQDDAIAAVKTKGLLGEKYVQISPGASDQIIGSGGTIWDTQPPLDIERAIGNFLFGSVEK